MSTIYNFAESSFHPIISGATFPGRRWVITSNGAAPSDSISEVEISFRFNSRVGKIKTTLNTTSGVTINDAANWDFQMDAIDELDWNAGTYYFDVKITTDTGRVKKYIWGILPIVQNVT